ncbi:hypothetical protein E2C01_070330 [Portunus trituberculatus]|uniref:Uncharacterized protein n=1 Tax=Portunus trituberculatus TaxID=210409 RepID=A0A5B7HTW5_PORTR|nr:hypothetical protein [Portunus trituberculatus]
MSADDRDAVLHRDFMRGRSWGARRVSGALWGAVEC